MKLRDFLTEATWCQSGGYAEDARGNECKALDDDARKWCIMGAMQQVYSDPDERQVVENRYASLIRVLHSQRIKDFNDTAEWADVHHILETIDA